jgi:hypothetical protein
MIISMLIFTIDTEQLDNRSQKRARLVSKSLSEAFRPLIFQTISISSYSYNLSRVFSFLQACPSWRHSSPAKGDENLDPASGGLGKYVNSAKIYVSQDHDGVLGISKSIAKERSRNPHFELSPEMAWQYLEGAMHSFTNLRVLK